MKKPKNFLILGAGPTGLGAACQLVEKGCEDWKVCERNAHVGGLSASFRDEAGFTWDIGGHVTFSHYGAFDRFFEEMTGGEVFSHERRSFIRIAGRFVPYPFQNNIRHLPEDLLEECLEGLEDVARRGGDPDTSHFLAWNRSRLGEGITRIFIEPDNWKRWACPLDGLSADWVADRVSPVDIERIRENIRLERDDVSWGPNSTFQFPKRGGTGSIFEAAAARLGDRLELEREAVGIDPDRKVVRFSAGVTEPYDALLSTMPIDRLMTIVDGAPDALVESASRLQYSNSLIVGLGFKGACESDKCWVYCPEEPAPFYRVTYFSNYSPFNAPDENHYSLMCDISYSEHLPRDKETIIEETVEGLVATGMIRDEDREAIVSTYLIDAPYSYPVPSIGRDAILGELHGYLERLGIHSRGRFGTWLYEIGNMDHSVMMGMEWADRILEGGRENVWLDRK